ncbi:hypothetical protein MJD09_01240 [bacterium]|nr:hypothetical protein [bacterium]
METLEHSKTEQQRGTEKPASLGAAVLLLFRRFAEERALAMSGMVGLALGIAGLVLSVGHGPVIAPEGVLQKAISFDLAVGIYILTLLLFLPLAKFTERGLRWWRGWQVALTYIAYGIENIQIGRGLDPRFTRHGTPLDNLFGGIFFLIAVGMVVMFLIMAVKIFRNRAVEANTSFLLAARYAFATTMLAFGAGFWMSFIDGPLFGTANILPLHGIGFHRLQAIPLVALFLKWTETPLQQARRTIHLAGLLWLAACITIAWQTMLGRTLMEPSTLPVLTVVLLLAWGGLSLRATLTWLKTVGAISAPSV